MGNGLQTHLENIETKLGGEVSSEHKDLGQHLEYIESLLGEGGSGSGGIQLKTINGESIIGTGNIEISGGGGASGDIDDAEDLDIERIFKTEYNINVSFDGTGGGTVGGAETIWSEETAEVTITSIYGDYSGVTVAGADYEVSQDLDNITITLSNATSDVDIVVTIAGRK